MNRYLTEVCPEIPPGYGDAPGHSRQHLLFSLELQFCHQKGEKYPKKKVTIQLHSIFVHLGLLE